MKTKIFDQRRGTGKTYNLIKESLNTGVPILCKDYRHAKMLQEQSVANFNELCKTITLEELKGNSSTDIIVDDVEWFFRELLHLHYSFTGSLTCISVSRED